MVAIDILYKGNLRCEAAHEPSGAVLETDAPKDNQGEGSRFSPTDLVGAALGTCMVTIMGMAARKLKIDIDGTTVHVEKRMVAQPSRRIGELAVVIRVPTPGLSDEQKEALRHAAFTCPVHESLHPDVHIPVEFVWS